MPETNDTAALADRLEALEARVKELEAFKARREACLAKAREPIGPLPKFSIDPFWVMDPSDFDSERLKKKSSETVKGDGR